MKCIITNDETKRKHEFTAIEFAKKLSSFLTLYARDKSDEERKMILERAKLAVISNSIFLFRQDGFQFMVLPDRRE